ncbi:MAG: sodium-dependent transporter [Thiotrichales bacterium]
MKHSDSSPRRISLHGQWSSRLAFILAASGSAIGLGNIWKFPYVTGQNGGGAFVLLYLLCIALIGLPIMIAEIMLGRRGRQSPMNTMATLAREEGAPRIWRWLGGMGIAAGVMILSFYSVIGGWTVAYAVKAAANDFAGGDGASMSALFAAFVGSWERLLLWHTLFMVMTMLVVARGVRGGLERATTLMMPGLLLIMVLLLGYAIAEGDFPRALNYLFNPDFSKLTADSVVVAMGQAFFTLSLGMGAIMMYGSYLPDRVSIARSAVVVALADTAVAILAGLVVFPIVFGFGLATGAGPGLIFETLPIAFGRMPGGAVIGALFFVMLILAAWTSAISIIEPAVAYLVENRGLSRAGAATVAGMVTWALGIGTVLSFNHWAELKLLGKTFFDWMDYLTANVMLPLGGMLIAVFAAWVMKREHALGELQMADGPAFEIWHVLVRFVAPLGVLLVFLSALGIIRA